ncbi:MAG TPA: tryptophan synthase subunit beta, partial [Rhodospirillales bacterium]|nr:tryptophan synthase subunit beta [Rhodospirillales bacterium]
MTQLNTFRAGPDDNGHFGIFGGRYVAETLMPLILEVEKTYDNIKEDPIFQKDFDNYLNDFVGRPSPL